MNGAQLRAIREAHGLTQEQLGELLSYTANHLAMVEREEVDVAPRLEKLVRALLLTPQGALAVTPRQRAPRKR